MMKFFFKIILLVMFLYQASVCSGQIELEWLRENDGPADEFPYFIRQDPSNNLIVAGETFGSLDLDPGPAVKSPTAMGSSDIYLQKFDPSGNLLWAQRIGSSGGDAISDLRVNNMGEIFIAVSILVANADLDPGPGVFTLPGPLRPHVLMKFKADGTFAWAKGFNSSMNQKISCALDGSIFLFGTFGINNDFDPSPATYSVGLSGSMGTFLLKLNSQGNFVWVNTFNTNDNASLFPTITCQDTNDNFYLIGKLYGTTDFDPGTGVSLITGKANGLDNYILKLDSAGNFLWAKSIQDFLITHALIDNQGNFIFTGLAKRGADYDPGPGTYTVAFVPSILEEYVGSIMKINMANFSLAWVKTFPSGKSSIVKNSQVLQNGDIIACGYYRDSCLVNPSSNLEFSSPTGLTSFIVRLAQNGNYLWHKQFEVPGGYLEGEVFVTTTQDIYLYADIKGIADVDPGIAIAMAGNNNTPINHSVILLKFNRKTLGLNSNTLEEKLEILPNPNNGAFSLMATKNEALEIFDVQGRLRLQKEIVKDEKLLIESGLEKGLYFIVVRTADGVISRSKLVVE